MMTANLLTASGAPSAMATSQNQPALQQHSAWHSPVPYLFGGLAAMLGLIAFALLILACSYWKLSGYLESGSDGSNGGDDLESGDGKRGDAGAAKGAPQALEQRIVVIMAGDEKPTFLATPMSSRASSFGDNSKSKGSDEENKAEDEKPGMEAASGDGDSGATQHRQRQEEGTHENQEETQHGRDHGQGLEENLQSADRDQ